MAAAPFPPPRCRTPLTEGSMTMELHARVRPRLVWLLLGGATLLLLLAALLFADGAAAVAASVPRLLLAIGALTSGGTLAVMAVLEAWQPPGTGAPISAGNPPERHASSAGSPAGPT